MTSQKAVLISSLSLRAEQYSPHVVYVISLRFVMASKQRARSQLPDSEKTILHPHHGLRN